MSEKKSSPDPSFPCLENLSRSKSKKPHLVLHMDINKTLIIYDSAAKKPTDVLLSLGGKVIKKPDPESSPEDIFSCFEIHFSHPSVEINGRKPQYTDSEYQEYKRQVISRELMSVDNFISEVVYTYLDYEKNKTKMDESKIYEYNQRVKKRRLGMIKSFLTTKLGKPYKQFHEKMMKILAPPTLILPGFYECLRYLTRKSVSFSVVFRSFGTDIKKVIEEFSKFCDGTHWESEKDEKYPNLEFSLEDKSGFGRFYRTKEGYSQMIVGDLGEEKSLVKCTSEKLTSTEFEIINGKKKIFEYFMEQSVKNRKTMFFRDHYYYWNMHGEYPKYGKLFLIDDDVEKNKDVLQMFFDDNVIFHNNRGIVDLQNLKGEHLETRKFLGLYLHQVNPIQSITDKWFFLKKVEGSLERFCKIAGIDFNKK